MKKIYTLMVVLLTTISFGQNLVVNPTFDNGLNNWTAGTTSTYTLPTLTAADGSDGSNSAKYIPTATTGFYQEMPVTAGVPLNISFWYKATGDGTDARIWSNYKDAAGVVIYQAGTGASAIGDPLRNNNDYLPVSAAWVKYTLTVTPPANVTVFVLAVRAYNGGTVSFDQFSVNQTPLSVNQNQIEGLKVYVNNKNLNVTSNSNELKLVSVYNILGKQVLNTTTSGNPINVSELSSGIYIVKVSENGKTSTLKVVIQ